MVLFFISTTITMFLLAAALFWMLGGKTEIDDRLMEISAPPAAQLPDVIQARSTGLGRFAAGITGIFGPVRGLISGSDAEITYRLTVAGFRKPEHVEIFAAIKMLLPVLAVAAGTFFGAQNMVTAILVGGIAGFVLPDLVLKRLVSRRQDGIRAALPDALDLLVICMEAGLGIDQAMVRVGEEIRLTSPALAEELQIINREQRAGKPRLDAWRSMAERVDIDFVRQFVAMLVQTERFGTPIANALGQFADALRTRRTQIAEEAAAKASVKLIFPLVFLIFPSIFVVTIGPALIGILKLFSEMAK